jgi:hypothetical protein
VNAAVRSSTSKKPTTYYELRVNYHQGEPLPMTDIYRVKVYKLVPGSNESWTEEFDRRTPAKTPLGAVSCILDQEVAILLLAGNESEALRDLARKLYDMRAGGVPPVMAEAALETIAQEIAQRVLDSHPEESTDTPNPGLRGLHERWLGSKENLEASEAGIGPESVYGDDVIGPEDIY